MSLKIVHIITGLSTGGAEMMLYKLLSRMNPERFRSSVVSLMDGGPIRDRIEGLGIPVDSTGMRRRWPHPARVARLVRVVRAQRPDLIQAWMTHGCLAAEFVRLFMPHVPELWNIRHSLDDLSVEKPQRVKLLRWLARLSSRPAMILYNSRTSARQHEAAGYDPSRTLVIPNGFDCEQFHPDAEARIAVRRELGLKPDAVLIGLAARLHPVKHHANFLEAAALLSRQVSGVHFVLIGRGVKMLCLGGRFHLLGERHDMPRLTAALDIATCCSVAESFPNVVGEAMACGVPCVATDVGDSAWIVGPTGCVVPARDPAALCTAWRELVDLGPEGRRALGEAARARVRQDFSLDRVAGLYEHLYEQICGAAFRPHRALARLNT